MAFYHIVFRLILLWYHGVARATLGLDGDDIAAGTYMHSEDVTITSICLVFIRPQQKNIMFPFDSP
jgi:hypothetical protein